MQSDPTLVRFNPRLLQLEHEYRSVNLFEHGPWESYSDGIDIEHFRGEGFYLAQLLLGMTPEKYRATFNYVQSRDPQDYLHSMGEDDAFGCITFQEGDVTYSRDLLDSILEVNFLRETLGFTDGSSPTLLDIGAGYGRLMHRFLQAFPRGRAGGVDAVPLSTFVCEKYMKYRNCQRATVVPLTALDELCYVDVACNIHSFSECTLSAINFWLDTVVDLGIKNLFLTPHDERWICCNRDGSHPSMLPAIEAHGFKLVRSQNKFTDGLDGVFPTVYTMWER